MAPRNRTLTTLRVVHPEEQNTPFKALTVDVPNENSDSKIEKGIKRTKNPDGSMTFDFAPQMESKLNEGFYENLALKIDSSELDRIAAELLQDIEADDLSRKDWVEMRASGIKMLGLKPEDPRNDVGTSSVPLEGMSTIRHPLLLEAVLRFQANARGELLPAAGPVKVRNDSPVKPFVPPQAQDPNQPPPVQPPPNQLAQMSQSEESVNDTEDLADALETDFNHYLTSTAPEYYPDTDRMLFYVGFGGQGFKKVYHCPLRRRPVSESVDAEDIIVSDSATSLEDCGRLTQRIKMRQSTLKRMQIVGAYRMVELPTPSQYMPKTPVDQEKADIQGIHPQPSAAHDTDYELYESYCELDIVGYEHKKGGKETGLRCPYKVTVHKDSRQILEVRRAWAEEDPLCLPKQYFVEYPFVRGLGFYALGLLHILGNTTRTLTAAWREMLDAGMFASFPGFIYDKSAGRQLTNQFRVPPGGGIPVQVGPNRRIQDVVMALPYKEAGAGFTQFIAHVEEVGQRVGGTAEIKIGEGTQDIPVGTTLAVIEQSTKILDAVHKRLHASQQQEFQLLKERFKEDPEAFWRHNKKPTIKWRKAQFIRALENCFLVPVADPNNPTSLHRIAKAVAIKTLEKSNPGIYDPIAVDTRILRIINVDPEGLFNKNPQATPPDPRLIAANSKAQADQIRSQIMEKELQIKAAQAAQQTMNQAADRNSRERIEQMKIQLEQLRIKQEEIIHGRDLQADQIRQAHEMYTDTMARGGEVRAEHARHTRELQQEDTHHQREMVSDHLKHQRELASNHAIKDREFELEKLKHRDEMELEKQKHAEELKVKEKVGMEQAKHQPKPVAKKPKK